MKIVNRKGVRVDLCPDCGALWFDGGELEEMIRRRGGKSYEGQDGVGPDEAAGLAYAGAMGTELLLDILLSTLSPL